MSFLKSLRKPESTVALFFWTILWVPFQAVLFIPISLEAMFIPFNQQTLPSASNLFSFNPQVFVGYILAPIVYCSIVSLIFKPKRIVSPLHIQIGAFVLVASDFVFGYYVNAPFTFVSLLSALIFLVIYALIAVPIGFIQKIIVRLVIGLDYDEENIQQVTYSCNANFETLKTIFDPSFINAWKFKIVRNEDTLVIIKMVLKSRLTSSTNIVLAMAPDRKNSEQSVLSIVAYRQTLNYVIGSKEDLKLIEGFYKNIRQSLFDINVVYDLTEDKTVGTTESELAKLYAKQPTKSVFGLVKDPLVDVWRTSRYHAYAIAVLIAIMAGVTLAFELKLGGVDANTYLNILVLVVLVFVAELGISLRGELDQRKVRDVKQKSGF